MKNGQRSMRFPWWYPLLWPVRLLQPSRKNHTGLLPASPFWNDRKSRDEIPIRLLFFGDLMPMKAERFPQVAPDVRALVASADLVLGNCESPVVRGPLRKTASHMLFSHRMSEEFLRGFLVRLGARPEHTLLSVANNHAGDAGKEGVGETAECIRRIGAHVVGEHRATPFQPTIIPHRNLRFGVAAWTHWLNRHSFNGHSGVCSAEELRRFIAMPGARPKDIDVLIGLPHWDYEFHHFPQPDTRRLACELTAAGFDLLVGCHSHLLGPLERMGGALCHYSLGNLNGPSLPHLPTALRLGAFLEVEVAGNGERRGNIIGYRVHPLLQEPLPDGGVRLVRLLPDRIPDRRLRKILSEVLPEGS